MSNKKKDFKLFTHEELELKNALVTEARDLTNSERFSGKLASAMIYVSIAEYLGEHLLDNLDHLSYRSTYYDYAAILYFEKPKNRKQTLGAIKRRLEEYVFPEKTKIIKLLEKITTSRNHLFHNLAKTSTNDWKKLEEDITDIQTNVEDLIEKFNVVTEGLRKIIIPQSTNEENEKRK